MKKKISVIIPIYNMELYLEECLDSVINQTLKDIEILCINDGSTDNSLAILNEYASKYEMITILNQENAGVGTSRNRGIDAAKGKFIAFMDSDDFYPSNDILECLYNKACEQKVNICGGGMLRYFNGEQIKHNNSSNKVVFEKEELIQYVDYQVHIGFTRFIYRTEFLQDNCLYFPTYARFEDPVFMTKAFVKAKEFYAVNKNVYIYRFVHDTKKNINITDDTVIGILKGCQEILEITKVNCLDKLHKTIVNMLTTNYWGIICRSFSNNNEEAIRLIQRIEASIDKELINNNKIDFNEKFIISHIENSKKEETEFIRILEQYKKVIIYGAGIVGHIVYDYLRTLSDIEIISFAVSDNCQKDEFIGSIPINNIDELTFYCDDALVILATLSKSHPEMVEILSSLKFKNIYPINFRSFCCYSRLPYISI